MSTKKIKLKNNLKCFLFKLCKKYELDEEYFIEKYYNKFPKVKTVQETIECLINTKKSIIRFGDGELELIKGNGIPFQKPSKQLSDRLKEVLSSTNENILIGLPHFIYSNKDNLQEIPKNFWRVNGKSFRDTIAKFFKPDDYGFFVAIGYTQVNKIRERIVQEVKSKNYHLVSYVHPSSNIANNVEIKENTFVFENVVIQPFSKCEENIIIWSNATICHDCIIEKNCFIGSNACINGFARIKRNTFIGANSTIRNNITIGECNIIGAGCTILDNTCSNSVYKSLEANHLDIASEKLII